MASSRFRAARVIVTAVAAMMTVWLAAPPAGAVGETPTRIDAVGSDVMFRLGQNLDELYNSTPGCELIEPPGTTQLYDYKCLADTSTTVTTENYFHDEAYSSFPEGGSAGIKQICQQGLANVRDADFARQTSAPSATVCDGLAYVAIGRDALTWEAWPGLKGPAAQMNNQKGTCKGSKGFCLTQNQLVGIFVDCTITTWGQIGVAGSTAKIAIYTARSTFGTRTQWDTFLGGDSSTCIPDAQKESHETRETENPLIVQNADAKRAISLASSGTWNGRVKPYPDGSKLGAVDGVPPSPKTIVNGDFPFGRFIFDVYCTASCSVGAASGATVRYVGPDGWICKPAGQHGVEPFSGKNYRTLIADTIKTWGFVPLPLGATGGGAVGQSYCRLTTTPIA